MNRFFNFYKGDEEHRAALEAAKRALEQSQHHRKVGKERLENAIKKYKERSGYGPSRNI